MNNDFNKMVLEEVRGLRHDMSELREDLAYLKGKLGHGFTQKDDKKELAKTGGISGLVATVIVVVYEFINRKFGQ